MHVAMLVYPQMTQLDLTGPFEVFSRISELTLDLVSIRVNGRMVDLNTEEVTTSSDSRGSKSGKVIGGTAAVGAILGGIFGGGKGAAIGAASLSRRYGATPPRSCRAP